MIKKIGLTGGIGSGKSTVAALFESLGFKVYYSDSRARWLSENDKECVASIKELFGASVYLPDGSFDRKAVGAIVFKDENILKRLNSIIHPAARRDFESWLDKTFKDYEMPFVLKEAAILFESGAARYLDGVINVHADIETRIARVISRDRLSREEVLHRMNQQLSDTDRMNQSDFTILNDGIRLLLPQVQAAIDFFNSQ